MYSKFNDMFYMVNNKADFIALLDHLVPISSHIMDDLNRGARKLLKAPVEYPSFVTFCPKKGPQYTPVLKAVGSLGNLHLLDLTPCFDDLVKHCRSKHLVAAPALMLQSVTITERTPTSASASDPKQIRIVFSDGKFHGDISRNDRDFMFVSQTRDITDLIAHIYHDEVWDRYFPTYTFNHYDFLKAIPELSDYTDTTRWKLDFAIVTTCQVDFTKRAKEADWE